jgi:hypothetical protein
MLNAFCTLILGLAFASIVGTLAAAAFMPHTPRDR